MADVEFPNLYLLVGLLGHDARESSSIARRSGQGTVPGWAALLLSFRQKRETGSRRSEINDKQKYLADVLMTFMAEASETR